jgi:hypothetical protein
MYLVCIGLCSWGCIAHPEIDVACGDAEIKNGLMFHDHTSVLTWAASDFRDIEQTNLVGR